MRRLLNRIAAFFHKQPLDNDLSEEMSSHLAMATEENIQRGMSPEEARRRALVRFGGVTQATQTHRETRGLPGLDILLQDLRYTFRTLRRDRGFTIVTVLILALGIGANIVVFSLINTMLLRPLPFNDPTHLVWIAPPANGAGLSGATYSADAYDDLRSMNHSYTDVTGYFAFSAPNNTKLTGNGIPQPSTSIPVAGNFFHVLGVAPILGRDFIPQEAIKGAPQVALLSYPFWQRQYHADPDIVGKSVSMDNKPTTIVGVLPPTFDFGAIFTPGVKVDLFMPFSMDDIRDEGNTITLIGRLKPGVTLQQATAEAVTLFPQFYGNKRFPQSKGDYGPAQSIPMKEHVAGQLRRSLYVLWAAVGFILLIVCVNLSNLMLSRAIARGKEFALRIALGSGHGRLVRQLLTEATVLSIAGALLGLGIAFTVIQWLAHQGSVALPLLSGLRLDAASLGWTVLIAAIASLLFGLLPGLRIASGNLQESLKDSSQNSSDGRKHEALRTTLVISEVALACVLVVGAGLLLRSFLRVLDVDLGFQPAQASAITLDVPDFTKPDKKYDDNAANAYFHRVVDEVAALPGVRQAGITDNLPFASNRTWGRPGVKGVEYGGNGKQDPRPSTFVYIISPGYLGAMGMDLRGRDIAWSDDNRSALVMVLNQKAADFLFPNQDPLGRLVDFGGKQDIRIVGVVPDVHETDLEAGAGWQIYLSIAQQWGPDNPSLVVRSSLPAASFAPAVLQKLREINPAQPRVDFLSIQSYVDHATSPRRFFALLVGIFAALGLVLASLGIYGVISYSVTRQTQEFGIRMALGASRENVQLGVLIKTLRLALIGVAVGTAASFAVARAISSLLFGTQPSDPATFAAMILLLTAVACIAGYLPARRASRINPVIALRNS
jgi:predicted permease